MAGEREPFSLLIANLQKKIAEVQTANPSMAKPAVIRQALRESLTEPPKPEAAQQIDAKKLEADQFNRKIREGAEPQKHQERKRFRKSVQVESPMTDAQEIAQAVQEVLVDQGKTPPTWLAIDKIKASPDVAEFAVRVSLLPEDLQKNPAVVYQELSRLYYRTKWTELTHEAYRETKDMIQRVYDNVLTPEKYEHGQFVSEIDDRFNIYRTEKLEPLEDPGDPPTKDRKSAEYKDWERRRIAAGQREQLDITLNAFQRQLDSLEDPDLPGAAEDKLLYLKDQRDLFRRWVNELSTGQARTVLDHDVEDKYAKFGAEAQQYVDRAEGWQKEVQKKIDSFEGVERARKDRESQIESGQIVEWTSELQERFKHDGQAIGAAFRVNTHALSPDDVALILQGEEGQKQWLAKFRDKLMNPHKEFRMDFAEQQTWNEAERLMEWLWGERHINVVQRIRDRFNTFEDIDAVGKAVLYRPKPGKVEDYTKALRFLSPEKAQVLCQTELIDITKPFFTESIDYFVRKDLEDYDQALKYLLEPVDNPFQSGDRITRNKLLTELDKRVSAPGSAHGTLTEAQARMREDIQVKLDRVGMGVLLRDYHMLPNESVYNRIAVNQKRYLDIEWQLDQARQSATRPLGSNERQSLEVERAKLGKEIQDLWKDYTLNPNATISPEDAHTVKACRGLSPVEIEARKRTIGELKMRGMSDSEISDIEWKIYEALWSARNISVGLGEAMEIGSKLGKAPIIDLKYKLKRSPNPKHFMDRGFAEAYQRVLNPSLFADDFGMGGELGDSVRNIYYSIAFRRSGYDLMKDAPREWKNRLKSARRDGIPEWVVYADYAQEVLGISYTEVVRPELLATGLQSLSTTWRFERIALEPLREEFVKKFGDLPPGAIPDNQALGYQFNIAQTAQHKEMILRRMLERKITIFTNLIGSDLAEVVRPSGLILNSLEWQNFQRALSLSEMHLWQDESLRYRQFDFANRNDFNLVMPRALEVLGVEPTGDRMNMYYNAMLSVKQYMEAPGANGKARLSNWVKHRFKHNFTLCSSDFNWMKADFARIGMYALERRINDFIGQSRARDGLYDILYKSEILSPIPGKETDTLMKVKEFRDAIISYAGPDDAELAQTAVLETIVEFNRNRAINVVSDGLRGLIGFVPGGVSIMRKMGGVEHVLEKIPGWEKFAEHHKLLGKPIAKWPRSIADAVSLAVGFGGHEANAWDEYKIAGLFAGAETSMMYTNNPKLLHDLMDKYHTGLLWRMFYGVPRKYWWVVPVATIAVAASQSVEDEKKESH